MNKRQEERLADLNTAYQNEVRNIMEEDTIREAEPMEMVMESPTPIDPEEESMQCCIPPYNLTIEQVNNGFIVKVGCQTFVFEKFETACKYMTMYYNDVEGTRKKHVNGTLFA